MISTLLLILKQLFFMTGYVATAYPKPLSQSEEKKCLLALAKGDQKAREKLIMHNMRLVAHIAKKYSTSADKEDLISVGSLGLIKGVQSFSPNKGTTLATYLSKCIENEILMMLRSGKRTANTVYLDDTLGVDNDGNEYSLMDVLSVDEESVYEQAQISIMRNKLLQAMKMALTQREQTILKLRFGLEGCTPLTQNQTAKKLGISRSYVSRLETKALERLKELLSLNN
ncbi:MAG: RNA polymerase sporulation sigma factor SigK [Clostridia bacterium]|nr:RNA polymerase sporulation sigma factor SigK [Clostridia bacterium]